MNAMSKSRAETPVRSLAALPADHRVLIWDAPVRVFHWLMVFSFAGAYITAESERWRLVHVTLGYTMAGLLAFRLVWGIIGTNHARFSSFVQGPSAVKRYLQSLMRGNPERYVGHNPAGAIAIIALLALTGAVTAAGWAAYTDIGGEWLKDLHAAAANTMVVVVGVHLAGVLIGIWMHRENLIGAMLTGRKSGRVGDALRSAWTSVALLMVVAVLVFWTFQWQSAPAAGAVNGSSTSAQTSGRDDD